MKKITPTLYIMYRHAYEDFIRHGNDSWRYLVVQINPHGKDKIFRCTNRYKLKMWLDLNNLRMHSRVEDKDREIPGLFNQFTMRRYKLMEKIN